MTLRSYLFFFFPFFCCRVKCVRSPGRVRGVGFQVNGGFGVRPPLCEYFFFFFVCVRVFSGEHVTHHVSSTCDRDPSWLLCVGPAGLSHTGSMCQEKRVNKMTRGGGGELARFVSYKCECHTEITLLQETNYAAFPSEISQFSFLHVEYVLKLVRVLEAVKSFDLSDFFFLLLLFGSNTTALHDKSANIASQTVITSNNQRPLERHMLFRPSAARTAS